MSAYVKAIVAAVLAGLTTAGAAVTDGHLTAAEGVAIAIAIVGTFGGVYVAPANKAKATRPQPGAQ